ncbi:hypothetical protein [Shewanella sp.]|uniref:hypothetical protein n=1 Tax=Shewanella sp. TaxID=50422 RepID=UPI003A97EB92
MGFKIGWIAVKDSEPAAIHKMLSLSPSGEREEFPDSPIAGVELPNGWYLVHFNDFLAPALEEESVSRVSSLGDVVACQVHEGIMVSMASGYKSGQLVWSVVHNAQEALEHLETRGSLPGEFEGIKSKKIQEQAQDDEGMVDYIFDIPVDMARAYVGYRYDQALPNESELPFQVLEQKQSIPGPELKETSKTPAWMFWKK